VIPPDTRFEWLRKSLQLPRSRHTVKVYTSIAQCTGYLIGTRFVLTAGHCLLSEQGQAASYAWVWPGLDEYHSPYSASYGVIWDIDSGWVADKSNDYDYAVITLAHNIGWSAGFVGPCSVGSWENDFVDIYGYPGDKPSLDTTSPWWAKDLWAATGGAVVHQDSLSIRHEADTYEGNSGSGVLPWSMASYDCPAAVHTGAEGDWNHAVRITNARYYALYDLMALRSSMPASDLTYQYWGRIGKSEEGNTTLFPPKIVSYPNVTGQHFFNALIVGPDGTMRHKERRSATDAWSSYFPTFSTWTPIGGTLSDFPTGAKRTVETLDVAAIDHNDDGVYNKLFDGSYWNPSDSSWWSDENFQAMRGPVSVASCTTNSNRFYVVAVDSNRHVRFKYWDGSWHAWADLYASAQEGVDIVCSPTHLTIAIADYQTRECRTNFLYFGGGGWFGWYTQGYNCVGTPDLVVSSQSSYQVDLFSRTTSDTVYWKRMGGSFASADLGGNVKTRVAAVSRYTDGLDLYAVDWAGQVYTKWYNGSYWSAWAPLGGYMLDIDATSSTSDRVELLARGRDNQVYYRYWSSSTSWSQGPYGFE
jgi:V8-like Glu-specific endopeptidase